MTTVGFGDIYAVTVSEKLIASIIMVFGAAVLGYIMGNVSLLLQEYDLTSAIQRKNMEALKSYCVYYNL